MLPKESETDYGSICNSNVTVFPSNESREACFIGHGRRTATHITITVSGVLGMRTLADQYGRSFTATFPDVGPQNRCFAVPVIGFCR